MVLVGLGLGVRRAVGLKALDAGGLADSFWLGFAVVIAAGQVWHLWLPITAAAACVLAAAGLVGLAVGARQVRAYAGSFRPAALWWLAAIAIFALWLANVAIGPLRAYDTGLYHLPMVEWVRQFAIVPGLGNLHGRLAFNNANLLYAAALEFGPWLGHCAAVAHGPVIIVALAQGLRGARRLLAGPASGADDDACLVVLLPLILFVVARLDWFPGLYGDLPVAVLCIVGGARAMSLLRRRAVGGRRDAYSMIWIGAVLTTAICIKLSAAVFAGLTLTIVWIVWLIRTGRISRLGLSSKRALGAMGMVVAFLVLLAPWAVRGAVLSGHPFYPSTFLSVDADWQVPPAKADQERLWVQSWARTPGADISQTRGWSWLGGWGRRLAQGQRYLLILPVAMSVAGMAAAAAWRRKGGVPRGVDPGWLMLIPLVAGLAVWLLAAPGVRFAVALVWFAAAFGVSVAIRAVSPGAAVRRGMLVWLAILCIWPLAHGKPLWTGGEGRSFAPTPAAPMDTFETDSGLVLYVPATGDQSWYAPLPNTPYPSSELRLRGKDLSGGFTRRPADEP